MKFSNLGEFGFIDRIARQYPAQNSSILKGIGDDAAVVSFSDDSVILLTTDQLLEGFHFRLDKTDGWSLGKKALAVNLSDIAAMGGVPIGFTLSLGIPTQRISVEFLDDFYKGIASLGSRMGVELLGGDTAEGGERLTISVALLGKALKNRVIYREGGKDGDGIYMTGWLGDAALGLRLIEQGVKKRGMENLLERHLGPEPRTREGQLLAERGIPDAMIDISDGLLSDLNHIVSQSRIGAEIELSLLPLSPEFQTWAAVYESDPLTLSLGGGEDYELLFSVSPEKSEELDRLSKELSCPITRIGRLSRKVKGIVLKDEKGRITKAEPLGYDHFRDG
ncbi:MAG: thiamine-phosphate kinase [Deltaproteobacteria bacterium]|nr:thiamine-phosphate kinase [Deltaproteobacteria bacterium]